MSRIRSTDDAGRPIVAELGRAETPDEIAARKAAASERRRASQTAFNLVIALVASLGVVALIVLVVVRPQSVEREPVDYASVAADAQGGVDVPLAVPELPEGWSANRAELVAPGADGVQAWEIGLITPSDQYIGLVQGVDANSSWIAKETAEAVSSGTVRIGGVAWDSYDRRDLDDPGNLAYALVATFDRSTIVLGGTASDTDFATLAEAVSDALEGQGS